MKSIVKRLFIWFVILVNILTLCACSSQSRSLYGNSTVNFEQLNKTGDIPFEYATEISIDIYDNYKIITVGGENRYIVVPKDADVPYNLPEDITVLKQPFDKTYLVSTSSYDLIRQIDAADMISLSGTKESDWYIEDAKKKMANGTLKYAGKYSAPDYEMILSDGCNLAIENTMIYHTPEVLEKITELGIPALVEKSSYEKDPLGRLEWIKLYGVLYDKDALAMEYFNKEKDRINSVKSQNQTDKTVAVFYVNSSGIINVRKPGDYITKMIEIAGGKYALSDVIIDEENALSTMNMQMEDFYLAAKNADILIYNSTITGEVASIEDLVNKNALFSDFKAVQEGNVYCTGRNFFQETTGMADFCEDLSCVFNDADAGGLNYLNKLE